MVLVGGIEGDEGAVVFSSLENEGFYILKSLSPFQLPLVM